MKTLHKLLNQLSFIALYRLRWVVVITCSWTLVQLLLYYRAFALGAGDDFPYAGNIFSAYLLRGVILVSLGALMAYLLMIELRLRFRNYAFLSGWGIKTLLLMTFSCFIVLFIFVSHFVLIEGYTFSAAFSALRYYFIHTVFFIDSMASWLVMILITQVVVEVDKKYSPGVLWGVLTGKYMRPRTEKRIIMFLDLKDSTPIAEQLGHVRYFSFIKDFIYYVSSAVLENDGHIYQYVGDEVVVTWSYRKRNIQKAVNTVILSRKILQGVSDYFRRKYGIAPEFRVGLHTGEVTMGEIGVIKKDIAISGEAMNITARIRTACGELNQKFIVSQAFFESNVLKSWQGENLGEIELKGVEEPVKLYALKI